MILFVGDCDQSLSSRALAFSADACLIDKSNCRQILSGKIPCRVAYTSLADLPKINVRDDIFFELIDRAETIYYCPPDVWSDHNQEWSIFSAQRYTEFLLYEIRRAKNNVIGLDLSHWNDQGYTVLAGQRKVDNPQIWVAGCSIPHGIGVEPSERFGEIIAHRLNLPVSYLTRGGTGIPWAADQILRSDIRSHDIVIWAVTSENRFCVFEKELQHKHLHDSIASGDKTVFNLLENLQYRAITSLYQVINFCEKIDARLLLLPTICTESIHLQMHANRHWHAPPYQRTFTDYGTDDIHPGPKQHAEWAQFCLDLLLPGKS